MMKRFKLLLLSLGMLLAGVQVANAQNWPGHTPASLVNATGNDGVVYLWNVGTGQYLYAGGQWGTQAITYDTPLNLSVDVYSSGWFETTTYSLASYLNQIGSTSGYVGLTDGTGNTSSHDYNRFFCDARKDYNTFRRLYFDVVDAYKGIYNIRIVIPRDATSSDMGNTTRYMIATDRNGEITTTTKSVSGNEMAQWQLVTRADVINAVASGAADAAEANPIDVTYMLDAQHFGRNNTQISKKWFGGETFGSNGTSLTYEYGEKDLATWLSDADLEYYVGNGLMLGEADGIKPQEDYGNYWTANINGAGNVWQTCNTAVPATGWYRVSCDVITTATDGVNIVAQSSSGTSESVAVSATEAPESFLAAGQQLWENQNNHVVYIYLNEGETLTVGVDASSATIGEWTCIDNFQIEYCGNPESFLILDENETSIDYINAQVDAANSYTLILNRALTAGAWNSFILPVNLTAGQLKAMFGTATKLSAKKAAAAANPAVLEFESVDLSNNDAVALQAGVPYIMKPSAPITHTVGEGDEFAARRNNQNVYTASQDMTTYYTVPQISLTTAVAAATVTGNNGEAYDGGNAGDIYFKGTYTTQGQGVIKAGAYLLSEGTWYHMTTDVNKVKGFRTWLQSNDVNTQENIKLSVDGVIDGETTAIEGLIVNGVETANGDNKVYNMNGQLVRSNGASLEGLSKGVYIVNGKKYIVK